MNDPNEYNEQPENNYQNPEQYENYYQQDGQQQDGAVYAAPPVFGVSEEINQQTYDTAYTQQDGYVNTQDGNVMYEDQQSYYYQPEEGILEEAYQPQPQREEEPFEEELYERKPTKRKNRGEVVSTNQSINLTCTLAALMGPFALFLYFADQRSKAVRRMSVQSTALFFTEVAAFIVLWFLGAIFSVIPVLGVIIKVIIWLVAIGLIIITVFLKVQMMMRAYRGEAYELPLVGNHLRRFE